MEQLDDDQRALKLAERVRLFIYAFNRPVERLARDVADLARFIDADRALSPQLQLTCANPPLVPASAACVEAAVRIWGEALVTTETGRLLVATLAVKGPLATAQNLVLTLEEGGRRVSKKVLALDHAYRAVFAQFPDAYLADSRELLERFTVAGNSAGNAAPPPAPAD